MESVLSVLNVAFFNVIIPLLVLSFLIFIHELGHYLAARVFKVAIKEFAIGMGPKVFLYKSKKTKIDYAIRAIPMGGALTMHGEDEESEAANAVSRKPVWQRFIIITAGSFMNIMLGFIIMSVIVSGADGFYSTTINRFQAGTAMSESSGLLVGDKIIKIDDAGINIFFDLTYAVARGGRNNPSDVTVVRNGEKKVIEGVRFPAEGGTVNEFLGFTPSVYEKSFSEVAKQSFFRSISTINLIWTSFFDLLTGKFGVEEVAGPVGVTQIIGDSAREATESRQGGMDFMFILAVITMNLGVANLLPLPALDGGRIVFLAVELIRRKPINPEHEGYVHLAGFAMLILFMIFITYQDILKLIAG